MSQPLEGTESASNAIARVRYTHDAMIDMLIRNPTISQGELAKTFGYGQAWISRVINSDAFNTRLAERKDELVDPGILMDLDDRIKSLALTSLDIVHTKLQQVPTFDNAMRALELTTKALGYGAKVGQQNNVQNNFVVAMPAKVQDAAQWAERGRAAGHEAGGGGPLMQAVEDAKVVGEIPTE